MSWTIRSAVPADAEVIASIRVTTWRVAYAGLVPQDVLDALCAEATAPRWRQRLEAGLRAFVAELDDGPEGFVSFGDSRDDDLAGRAAEIYALYVLPQRQGRGAGRALVQAVRSALPPDRPLTLWVLEGNAAGRGFYERLGFVPDGARKQAQLGTARPPEVRHVLPVAPR